jgi:hypothetical protein
MAAADDVSLERNVHVIVTCTNRKSRPVPGALRLRSLAVADSGELARQWIRVLGGTTASPLPAKDLYAGEHWRIACGLPGLASGQARLWACSAGYGLIPADAPVLPYAATFAAGHPDSVPGSAEGATAWWNALSKWEGPSPGHPRSVQELVAKEPAAIFLLVLSAPYLRACGDDVVAASTLAGDPDRLMIVSAGARNPGPLGGLTVPADARLQAFLGGTRQALNVRIAGHLLSAGILSRQDAIKHLAQLLTEQPPIPVYERKKLSDAEVLALIEDGLADLPGASASRLLRQFRDAGYACEQGRFGRLHKFVTENLT